MYEYILKVIGYGLNQEATHELPLTINRHTDGTMEPQARNSENKIRKLCKFGYVYNFIIFLLISWKIPYILTKALYDKNVNMGGFASFPILISIQYLLGINYFNGNHFYSRLHDRNIKNRFNIYLTISSIVGLILTVTSVVLLICNIDVFAYTDIYTNASIVQKVFVVILIFVDMLFSNQIMVVNCCSFVTNLISHKYDIIDLINRIETNITDSTSTGIKIGTIAQDYSNIKDKYGDTVDATKFLFSSLNFFGFVHISFLIAMFNNNTYYVLHIIYAALFILIDIIFINVLQTVKSSIIKINGIVSSSPFMVSYFGATEPALNIDMEEMDLNKQVNILIKMNQLLTSKVIGLDQNVDWFNLQYITNQDWDKYIVLGIEISDTKILGRIVGLVLLLVIGKDLAILFSV